MTAAEVRAALVAITGDVAGRAYRTGLAAVTVPGGATLGYPDQAAQVDRVLLAADVYASALAVEDHEATLRVIAGEQAEARATGAFPAVEPPAGSVVAIGWGGPHQEVWVANSANVGNWYCPDIPMRGDEHPHWGDVVRRAQGRTLTLLVAGDPDSYAAGWQAAIEATSQAVQRAVEGLPLQPPAREDSR